MSNTERPETIFVNGLPISETELKKAAEQGEKLRPQADEAYNYVIKRFPGWRVDEFRDGFWGVQMEPDMKGGWDVTYGTNQYPGGGAEVFVGAQFHGNEETAVPWVRVIYRSVGGNADRNYVMIHLNLKPGSSQYGGIVFVEGGRSNGRFKTYKGSDFSGRVVSLKKVEDLADYLVRSDEMSIKQYVDRVTWEKLCDELEAMLAG